jgi:hypothetical protein
VWSELKKLVQVFVEGRPIKGTKSINQEFFQLSIYGGKCTDMIPWPCLPLEQIYFGIKGTWFHQKHVVRNSATTAQ